LPAQRQAIFFACQAFFSCVDWPEKMRARHPVMKKTSSTPALPGKKADSGSDRQKR
jgi:hypothetical protein